MDVHSAMTEARGSDATAFAASATKDMAPAGEREETAEGSLPTLAVAALGVVFGDIGTSPLYALRQCFHGPHGVAVTSENVLGLMALMLLIPVICVKYLLFILRADNCDEGGIIALVALLNPWNAAAGSRRHVLMLSVFSAPRCYTAVARSRRRSPC